MSNQGYLRREIAEWAYVGLVGFALLFTTLSGADASPKTADLERPTKTGPVACLAKEKSAHRSALVCEGTPAQSVDWLSLVGLNWAGPRAGETTSRPPWAAPRRLAD